MTQNPVKRVFYILFLFVFHFGLKAQTTAALLTLPNDFNSSLVKDSDGNLYYIAAATTTYYGNIKKITPTGSVIDFFDPNNNIYEIVIDSNNNIYFFNNGTIQKVSPSGTSSTFATIPSGNGLKIDSYGNLYLANENYTSQGTIKKITPEGIVSTISTGQISSYTTDYSGNLYYYSGSRSTIYQVSPGGVISTYASGVTNVGVMTFDTVGNLYYVDETNYSYNSILKLNTDGTTLVVVANDSNLNSASNLWSDAAGLYFTDLNFNTNPSSYVYVKITLACDQPNPPVASDQTFEAAVTVSNLSATGEAIQWYNASSGGFRLIGTTALISGTYYVSQTVNNCESNRTPVVVSINQIGLDKHGQITTNAATKVSKTGAINVESFVNKNGDTTFTTFTGNGILNYEIFTAPASSPNDATEFATFVNPSNRTSSGSYNGSLLLNWNSQSLLTNAGIAIPNNGDQFAVQVSGYFVPQETGTYTFTCEGDDAVDLFVNSINVANHYGIHGIDSLGSHTGTIDLIAGERYAFRARMQENGGGEGLKVFWRRPSESSGWYINTNELSSTNQ
jgi:hypothetical protein